jgi:hypothetical protein
MGHDTDQQRLIKIPGASRSQRPHAYAWPAVGVRSRRCRMAPNGVATDSFAK